MQFRELLRLRHTESGLVPVDILKKLSLPMPDEVMEEFLHAFGRDELTQKRFADVDLHTIRWGEVKRKASEIVRCSAYPMYREYLGDQALDAELAANRGWKKANFRKEDAASWRDRGTWRKSPLFFDGEVLGISKELHLIEGHTRVGALTGLVRSEHVSPDSEHLIWLGTSGHHFHSEGEWKDVLRTERIPFLPWLLKHQGDKNTRGQLASLLVEIQYNSSKRRKAKGENFEDVMELAKEVPDLLVLEDVIAAAHREWIQFTSA
jgi:hypothetical protein